MSGPTYLVPVFWRGQRIIARVQALKMLGEKWAVGYVTPTGRHRKLTIKGNERVLDTEAACIDRLRQIAAFRGWKESAANAQE